MAEKNKTYKNENPDEAVQIPCAFIELRDQLSSVSDNADCGDDVEKGDPWAKPEFGLHRLINSGASEQLPVSVVKAYIEENACDVNLRDYEGVTPLHQAAEFGLHAIAKLLIECGADVNAQDKSGSTPLINVTFLNSIYWIQDGMLETAKVLLDNGADLSLKCSQGKTALDHAKETCFDRGVYYLLAGIQDDVNAYPLLVSKLQGENVKVKINADTGYFMHNGNPTECHAGKVILGVLSKISDSIADTNDCSQSGRASCKIISIDEINADGNRNSNIYQFHHDDIEVEVLENSVVKNLLTDPSPAMGFIVEVSSKNGVDVYYWQDGESKILHSGEKFNGYFWQMTDKTSDGRFQKVHIKEVCLVDEKSKTFRYLSNAFFYSDEVKIKVHALSESELKSDFSENLCGDIEIWNLV